MSTFTVHALMQATFARFTTLCKGTAFGKVKVPTQPLPRCGCPSPCCQSRLQAWLRLAGLATPALLLCWAWLLQRCYLQRRIRCRQRCSRCRCRCRCSRRRKRRCHQRRQCSHCRKCLMRNRRARAGCRAQQSEASGQVWVRLRDHVLQVRATAFAALRCPWLLAAFSLLGPTMPRTVLWLVRSGPVLCTAYLEQLRLRRGSLRAAGIDVGRPLPAPLPPLGFFSAPSASSALSIGR